MNHYATAIGVPGIAFLASGQAQSTAEAEITTIQKEGAHAGVKPDIAYLEGTLVPPK
jgi:fructose-bisphosphate aldolase class 1